MYIMWMCAVSLFCLWSCNFLNNLLLFANIVSIRFITFSISFTQILNFFLFPIAWFVAFIMHSFSLFLSWLILCTFVGFIAIYSILVSCKRYTLCNSFTDFSFVQWLFFPFGQQDCFWYNEEMGRVYITSYVDSYVLHTSVFNILFTSRASCVFVYIFFLLNCKWFF